MLNVRIEKEIRQENAVLAGLSLRKLLCVLAGVVTCIVIYLATGTDLDMLLPGFILIGLIAGAFGWIGKDGLHMEDYILRAVRRLALRNSILCYRTANEYVLMYNETKGATRQEQSRSGGRRKRRKRSAGTQRKTEAAGRYFR